MFTTDNFWAAVATATGVINQTGVIQFLLSLFSGLVQAMHLPANLLHLPVPVAAVLPSAYQEGEGAENRSTLREILKWGHLGATVSVVIFLWNQHELNVDATIKYNTQIAVLEARVNQANADNATQDRSTQIVVSALTSRIDAQREDLRTLQKMMVDHLYSDGSRSYNERGR